MTNSPTWPTSLPQLPLANGLTAEMRDTRESFEPQRGPSISRPGFTADLKQFQVSFSLDLAQLATFEAFVRDDLARGSLKFGMRDPETLAIHLWKIVPGQGLYRQRRVGPGRVTVSMELLRSGTPWYAPYSPSGVVVAPEFLLDFEAGVYASGGARVSLSGALVATVGSISISGGALQCPGDGSVEMNTVGLTLPAAGTAIGFASTTVLDSDQRFFAGENFETVVFGVTELGVLYAKDGGGDIELGSPSSGVQFKAASAWDGDEFVGAMDGVSMTDSFDEGALTGVTPVGVGSENDGGRAWTGTIARIAVYNHVFTAAQLEELTGAT
ncbi:hypothetical protein [Vannielia litorea]|uniref:hypothetical protein n=1 Tax=Vannielia litorea TaxID=1217970 RepID=UPI001BCE696F|nr:hypothetical protein [Vannielia litorea]MBS8228356.1 hypothetical protein [Vannielia litorea]